MDDRNQDRERGDFQQNRHRGGGHRPRHRGGEHRHGGGGGGRSQRPLLTSAISAACLTLIALLLIEGDLTKSRDVFLLNYCVVLFGLSAIISYIAQRVRSAWVEKLSDYAFLVGTTFIIMIGVFRLNLF